MIAFEWPTIMRVHRVGSPLPVGIIGISNDDCGGYIGPGSEPAWTVLWSDGRTSIELDDDLRVSG